MVFETAEVSCFKTFKLRRSLKTDRFLGIYFSLRSVALYILCTGEGVMICKTIPATL